MKRPALGNTEEASWESHVLLVWIREYILLFPPLLHDLETPEPPPEIGFLTKVLSVPKHCRQARQARDAMGFG